MYIASQRRSHLSFGLLECDQRSTSACVTFTRRSSSLCSAIAFSIVDDAPSRGLRYFFRPFVSLCVWGSEREMWPIKRRTTTTTPQTHTHQDQTDRCESNNKIFAIKTVHRTSKCVSCLVVRIGSHSSLLFRSFADSFLFWKCLRCHQRYTAKRRDGRSCELNTYFFAVENEKLIQRARQLQSTAIKTKCKKKWTQTKNIGETLTFGRPINVFFASESCHRVDYNATALLNTI